MVSVIAAWECLHEPERRVPCVPGTTETQETREQRRFHAESLLHIQTGRQPI